MTTWAKLSRTVRRLPRSLYFAEKPSPAVVTSMPLTNFSLFLCVNRPCSSVNVTLWDWFYKAIAFIFNHLLDINASLITGHQ